MQKNSNEMHLYAMNFKRATGRMDGNKQEYGQCVTYMVI